MDISDTVPAPIDVEVQLDKIAQRYAQAGGVGITVLNMVGGSAEGLLDQLPVAVRQNLEAATVKALEQAMKGMGGGLPGGMPGLPGLGGDKKK